MTDRGLKRICASCGVKFYDFNKSPVICPACKAKFTGEIAVKSRRSKSTIAPDTVKRDEIEAKNREAFDDDDDTVSLEDVKDDDDDSQEKDDDLSIEDIDGNDDDDDLSDLNDDIDLKIDVEKE